MLLSMPSRLPMSDRCLPEPICRPDVAVLISGDVLSPEKTPIEFCGRLDLPQRALHREATAIATMHYTVL